MIQDKVELVIKKLQEAALTTSPVNLNKINAAFTADIISHYAYGVSLGCLDGGMRENMLSDATHAIAGLSQWLKFIPINFTKIKKLHPALIQKISPTAAMILNTHRTISSLAIEVLRSTEPKEPHKNIFATLADAKLPAEERSLNRLEEEGFVLLVAGTETTAHCLSVTMFYILNTPDIHRELLQELKTVMPEGTERPALHTLESLPLLV